MTSEPGCKPAPHQRRYFIELSLAMILFFIALVLRRHALEHGWWPLGFTLLPAVPILFVIAAIMRMLNRIDEFQRRIQLNAFAFSAMATAFVTIVCGLLEDVIIGPVSISIVWPVMGGLWGVSVCVMNWYYSRSMADA